MMCVSTAYLGTIVWAVPLLVSVASVFYADEEKFRKLAILALASAIAGGMISAMLMDVRAYWGC